MKKILLLFIASVTLLGCQKSVLMKYAEPEAKMLCEEEFYKKYHALVLKEEKKELENIKSISECEVFLSDFWGKRDTDPGTPQNEFKDEMEQRAQFIEKDGLFQNSSTPGVTFRTNGGFFGDMAKVYMLHGMPDYMEVLNNGRTFVDLMVWVYLDKERPERHQYRFLFYQKNDIASYQLFRPMFDMILGLQEINKYPQSTHPLEVYDELEQKAGWIFLTSLVYFSDNDIRLDEALRPPKPAKEIAKETAPNIQGDMPQTNEEIIFSNNFGSTVPAEFSYEIVENKLVLKLKIKHENLDWKTEDGELTAEIFVRIIVQNETETEILEKIFPIVSSKEKIEKKNSVSLLELTSAKTFYTSARVSVYLKNNYKYNSWVEEIKR